MLACLVPFTGFAQAIDTNRPGFSFSPNVVARGAWQMETGLDYTRFDSNNDALALPQAEFRYGIADNIELYASSLGWVDGDFGSGFLDPNIGAKISPSQADSIVKMAFLFQLSVPIGGNDVTTDSWDPSLGFVWGMSRGLGLAGTVKVSYIDDEFQLDNGLKLPFQFNNRNAAFVEWEANVPENGGASHWLNAGYQYWREYDVQIDFSAGVGLNDRAGDWRFGIGFSTRL
jgi:hypothetical protein